LCIHGLGLNANASTNFGKHISQVGIATYAIDVRGFGSWLKTQGHEQLDFKDSLLDIRQALLAIRAANPGLPLFLLGESMGGAIALRACSMYPELVDGLISSVPAGDRFQQKATDVKVAIHFLEGPNTQFDIGSKIINQATKSQNLREAWEADPLNRMNLSAKDLMQFQSFMNENKEAAKKIDNTPVLMVQGTLDQLVKPEGTWELFQHLATKRKTFLALPSEHLVFEEGQVKANRYDRKVAAIVASWIYSFVAQENALPHQQSLAAAIAAANSAENLHTTPLPTETQTSSQSTVENGSITPVSANQLEQAIALCQQGDYASAQPILENVVRQQPLNGSAHFWLSTCYRSLNDPKQAEKEIALARSLNSIAAQMKPEKHKMKAHMKDSNQDIITQPPSAPIDITGGAPTVLLFGAPWCVECQMLAPIINHAQHIFGSRVKIKTVDVEDRANAALLQQFTIGPIPTSVFLKSDGSVGSTYIGLGTLGNFAQGVRGIMR
jgi:alpha-beta hydrolase superfamily lysophospholipase/thioredoxin-like negative regulator of GroEL